MDSLDTIGRRNKTDKASGGHNYLSRYELAFASRRLEPIRLLEIGVLNGASLVTWSEYFPNARIVGADKTDATRRFKTDRIDIEIIDQSYIEDLVKLALKYGPFDIIIEDGSHLWEHQITTLKTLFPFLCDRGVYVIEDLQVNYGDLAPLYKGVASEACTEFLKRLLDYHIAGPTLDVSAEEDSFIRTYAGSLESIDFIRHACILTKGDLTGSRAAAHRVALGEPLVNPQGDAPVSVVAHVLKKRDILGEGGWVNIGRIQGVEIRAPKEIAGGISYCVQLQGGDWSKWVPGGEYIGGRGATQKILTGFGVKVSDPLWLASIAGRFEGQTEILAADGAEVKVQSPDGQALIGMQVQVRKASEARVDRGKRRKNEP